MITRHIFVGFTIALLSSGCFNPLGGKSSSDTSYAPGTLGSGPVATPGPTPQPTPFPPPTISMVTPDAGVLSGGHLLTFTGTAFRPGIQFKVGSVACTTSTYVSATSGTCVTPASATIQNAALIATNSDARTATYSGSYTYVGSPKIWLRADVFTTLNSGDLVATWVDSSTNANNFVQSNPGLQPAWYANVLNSKPVVRFNASEMDSTSPIGISGATARSTFFVLKKASANAKSFFGWGSNATNSIYDLMNYMGRYIGHFYVNDSGSVGPLFTAATWSLLTTNYDGSIFTFSIDGAAPNGSFAISLTTGNTTAKIGGGAYAPYNGYDGDIAEALVLSQAVSNTERHVIECYLDRKYQLNLPGCP